MTALAELLASFASAFTQAQRLITLHLDDGLRFPGQLLPQTVTAEEALSSPYVYRLRCLSPDAGIELKPLLGLPAAFDIHDARGGAARRCGLASVVTRLPRSTLRSARFHRVDATETEDSITGWDARRSLGTAEVSLMSYDYRRASASGALPHA